VAAGHPLRLHLAPDAVDLGEDVLALLSLEVQLQLPQLPIVDQFPRYDTVVLGAGDVEGVGVHVQ